MYKEDLALNNLKWLICHMPLYQTKPTNYKAANFWKHKWKEVQLYGLLRVTKWVDCKQDNPTMAKKGKPQKRNWISYNIIKHNSLRINCIKAKTTLMRIASVDYMVSEIKLLINDTRMQQIDRKAVQDKTRLGRKCNPLKTVEKKLKFQLTNK